MKFSTYCHVIANLLQRTKFEYLGDEIDLDVGCRQLRTMIAEAPKRIIFGNGGSSAIASHIAIDYSKNGGMPTMSFTDASALTCLGNDYGFDQIYAAQIEFFARRGDVVIGISSSGNSLDILQGIKQAKQKGCGTITLSGFYPDNLLRRAGDLNLFVPDTNYGPVEIAHLTLLHGVLDTK